MTVQSLRRVLLSLVVLAALVGVVTTGRAIGSGPTLSLDEYTARLDQSIQGLTRAGSEQPAHSVEEVYADLASIEQVRLPSGEVIVVAPALAEGQDREAALARLRLLRQQLRAADSDDTEQRLTLLEDVLTRPAFNADAGDSPSVWQRFVEWLEQLLERLPDPPTIDVGPIPGATAVPQAVGMLAIAAAAIFIAVLLSYWLRGLAGSFVSDAVVRQGKDASVPQTSTEAREQAMTLAQAGSYRQAVRHLYLSALLSLEENGLAPYDRSLTNRELLAKVDARDARTPVRRHLRPVVDVFDAVWYGIHEPDGDTFRRYRQHVDALLDATPRDSQ